MVIMLIILI